jgi:tetratricopeptide (TPR) repeat protein
LKKATSADPNNLFGWYWLGRAQLRSGRPEDAIQNFERVIKQRPDLFQVHHNLAEAYLAIYNFESAIDHVNTAINLNPNGTIFYVTLNKIYQKLGQNELAMSVLEKALDRNPAKSQIYIERGDIHKAHQRMDEALADYSQAVLYDPRSWEGYYKKGVSFDSIPPMNGDHKVQPDCNLRVLHPFFGVLYVYLPFQCKFDFWRGFDPVLFLKQTSLIHSDPIFGIFYLK